MNVSHCLEAPKVPERRIVLNKTSLFYTQSQLLALDDLNHYADVFLRASGVQCAGIRPRTKPLLLGGTGSGKTCVARRFAQSRGWNFLSIDSSAWVVEGAHTKPSTLTILRDHVRRHDRGVVLLDELDKLLPTGDGALKSSWSTSVFGECLCFLDIDERLFGHGWAEADIAKLRTKFFVIGAGAFEFFLREAKRKARGGSLGFGTDGNPPESFAAFLARSDAIPDEIASRFASPAVFIEPPSREDLTTAIKEIHQSLGIPLDRSIDSLIEEAEGTTGAMRWCENYLTRLLMEHPVPVMLADRSKEDTAKAEPPPQEKPHGDGSYDFFVGDTTEHVRQINQDVFRLRHVLASLVSSLQIAVAEGRILQSPTDKFWDYLTRGESFWDQTCRAIPVCDLCAIVYVGESRNMPLHEWQLRAWNGIRNHAPALAQYGLLDLWQTGWDLASRVNQRRSHLSAAVAQGRYKL